MLNKMEINPIETIDDISVLNEKYGIKSMDVNGELLNINGEPFGDLPEDFVIKKQELIDEYNGNLYQKKRLKQYPTFNEQLDMLWHEINTTGALSDSGSWFNTIKEIKDNHPKPNN